MVADRIELMRCLPYNPDGSVGVPRDRRRHVVHFCKERARRQVGVDVNDHRNALPFTVAAQGAITHGDPTMEFFQLIGNAASKLLKR